jgi:hypothetical protein
MQLKNRRTFDIPEKTNGTEDGKESTTESRPRIQRENGIDPGTIGFCLPCAWRIPLSCGF